VCTLDFSARKLCNQRVLILIWPGRILHRAWLTLWKPVPELISILGYDVPEAPSVFLAGIKADAVTLHWTRPGPNKPVVRYLIQVNGVNSKLEQIYCEVEANYLKLGTRLGRKLPLRLRD